MSSTKGCKYTGGMFLREQSGDSHLEGHQWPQNTHIPRRLACRTCVASASSLSRVCSPLSCDAPPAPLARAGSARRTCSPRAARAVHQALRAIAPEAGVCSSALLSSQRSLVFGRIRLWDVRGRHKKFEKYLQNIQTTLARTIENRLVTKY